MQVVQNSALLNRYMAANSIAEQFSRKDLHFLLLRYRAGESIASPNTPLRYFMFLVSGSMSVYALRQDGSTYPIENMKKGFLGDREFCGIPVGITAEAKTESLFVALHLDECREKLWDDNKFLRMILMNFSDKLSGYVDLEATQQNFEDRLLFYLENECPNHEMDNVGDAIYRIRCSRRQMQRILKKLVDEGTILHTGKGKYRLNY